MADFQRVVEEIRFFLQGADQTLREEIREWATAYAEAARDANERLRRCKEFLNQNLRSEAIHVADADPNLLDMVSVLDFPELSEWEEFCADHSLTAPPKLLLLVAEDLNQAYAVEQPLKEHLKKLRKLALVRAPLGERLAVMRKLADLDPDSHFWKEDIATFEGAWLREFEEEARQASARGDADRLKSLVQELQSDHWLQKPSEDLINSVKRSYVKVTRNSGRERLEQLLPTLIDAAQQGDVDRARRIRNDWEQAVKEARLGSEDPLAMNAAAALDWIAQHDQHAAAEAAFQLAVTHLTSELNLGGGAAISRLEQLRQEALAYGRPLAPELEARYASTVDRIRSTASWHRKLYLTGTIGGAVVVLGVLAFFIVAGMRGSAVRSAAERMQAFLEAGDLDAAARFRNELREQSPEVLTASQLTGLLDQLSRLEQDDEARAARFELHLETAQQFLDRSAVDKAHEELAAAEKIAKRAHESTSVERIRKAIELAQTDRSQDHQRQVETTIAAVSVQLDSAEKSLTGRDFAEATTQLTGARERMASVRDVAAKVPEDVGKRFREVQSRLDDQQRRLAAAREANLLESRITEALRSLSTEPSLEAIDRYESLLKEYLDKAGDTPLASGYRTTLGELGLARAAVRINQELRPWTGVDALVRLNHSTAESRSKLCRDLLENDPDCADGARLRNYQTYLNSLSRQDAAVATLQTVFQSALLKDVWMVEQGGKRWYSTDGKIADDDAPIESKLKAKAASIHFNYVYSTDGRKRLKKLQTPSGVTTACVRAPQTELSARVLEQLGKLRVAPDWERGIVTILQTIEEEAKCDPLLRVILLSSVLQKACEASTPLAQACEPHQRAIKDSGVDLFAFWMDPDDVRANESREKAGTLLVDKLPRLDEIPARLDRARESIASPLLTRYEVIGALRQDPGGRWTCELGSDRLASQRDLNLAIIFPGSGARSGSWKTIGSLRNGEVTLRAEVADLQAGRLVFASRRVGEASR